MATFNFHLQDVQNEPEPNHDAMFWQCYSSKNIGKR